MAPRRQMLAWTEKLRAVSGDLIELERRLGLAKIPEAVIEHLIGWIADPAFWNSQRIKTLQTFLDSLDHQPLSETERVSRWGTFLNSTGEMSPEAATASQLWLPERTEARAH